MVGDNIPRVTREAGKEKHPKKGHVLNDEMKTKFEFDVRQRGRNVEKLLKSRDSAILMCVSRRETRFVILTSVLCPYLVLVVAVVILLGSMQ